MIRTFDIHNLEDVTEITLCNPNGDELHSLTPAFDKKLTVRFNGVSEFTFTFPKYVRETEHPAYALLVGKRLVHVENYGYFLITNADKNEDGISSKKTVTTVSIDTELVTKRISIFEGTHKLYDVLDSSDTILGIILENVPSWTVSHVDPALTTKYRTFNVTDTNVYAFFDSEVSKAFECVFIYDYENRAIEVYSIDNAVTSTDIYFSFDNLIKESTFNEMTDELCTAISVYGGNNLTIRSVNPLGTNYIYNFDYFKTTDWMTQDLIDAIDAWEAAIVSEQSGYADLLTTLKEWNDSKVELESDLVAAREALKGYEAVLKAKIEQGVSLTQAKADVTQARADILSLISELSVVESTIDQITEQLEAINDLLSFENNFTTTQLEDLSNFIYENTYNNENIIKTDTMTPSQIQDRSQDLYDQAQNVLEKLSTPRYEFSMTIANFMALKEFEEFIDNIELGSKVYVEDADGTQFEIVLLELSYTFDNPTDFTATFSNRVRLDSGIFRYADLQEQAHKAGTAVGFNSGAWSNWNDEYKDSVSEFITSALDASLNEVINASNQEIRIDSNGLLGRKYIDETGNYEDEQVWLTSKNLVFTKDDWETASLAIGRTPVYNSDGSTTDVYGVVADAIVGRLIAGNELQITSEDGSFTVDQNGARLVNGTFIVTDLTDTQKITLNPARGILIETREEGSEFRENFYVDTGGNITLKGNVYAHDGTFEGEIIAKSGTIGNIGIGEIPALNGARGLYKDGESENYYIAANGKLKWGALTIGFNDATFEGTIRADKLEGDIYWNQIVDAPLPSDKFNTGSGYSANGITAGGTIKGQGFSMQLGGTGVPELVASQYRIAAGAGAIELTNSVIGIFSSGGLQLESADNLVLYCDDLYMNGNRGWSATVYVGSSYSNRRLFFTNGIFVGYENL